MKKKCKVVMLPTEKASHIHLNNGNVEEGQNLPEKLYFKEKEEEIAFKGNRIWKAQHLYILSDEKPKEGDWAICSDCNNSYQKLGKVSHVGQPFHFKNTIQINGNPDLHIDRHALDYCKKIIATTDKSLEVVSKGINPVYERLAQLAQSFIKKYLEEYNKGNIIIDIIVEYEEKWMAGTSTYGNGDYEYILKIDSKSNTIVISEAKNNYTREEVKILLRTLESDIKTAHSLYDNKGLEKWIEQKL